MEHRSILFNRWLAVCFAILGLTNHKQRYSLEGGEARESHMAKDYTCGFSALWLADNLKQNANVSHVLHKMAS